MDRTELFALAQGKDRETLKRELMERIPGMLATAPRWFLSMTFEEIAEALLKEVEVNEQRGTEK